MYTKVWFIGLLVLCGVGSVTAAFDPLTDPSLIGWWRCEEGQGNVVGDSSPKGNNGTFVNGAAAWTTGFRGEGSGIRLIGPTLVEVPPMGLTLTEATMIGWFLPNGTQPDWASIIMHRNPGPASGFNLLADRRLAYHWGDAQNTWDYRGTAYYAADEWTHCAVTVEPTKATFYVNGVSASVNTVTHPSIAWDGPTWLGGDGNSNFTGRRMNGSLDDVMFFSRALTAAEIKSLIPPRVKAYKPDPFDGKPDHIMALLMWTKGDTALFHDVYLGTSPELTDADRVATRQAFPMYFHPTPLTPGVTYYWRVDEIEPSGTVHQGDLWRFTMMPLTAYLPQPADGSENILLTPTLSWSAGQSAAKHHVYFGADRQAVEEAAAGADKGELDATTTNLKVAEALKPDMTYFWRVDETDSAGKVQQGPVWSFATVWPGPVGAIRQWWLNSGAGTVVTDLTSNPNFPDNPTGSAFVTSMEGPTDWDNNYGSRIYGWLYPPQTGDYTLWIASDDGGELWLSTDADPANKKLIATVATWTDSRQWDKEANQRSLPVSLVAGNRYYIEALMKEGGGGDNLAVAWQGPGVLMGVISAGGVGPTPLLPVRAYAPSPADGAVDTVQTVTLAWTAGEKAQQHEVYFGDDQAAVAAADTSSPLFQGRQNGTSFNAGDLEWGKTFYWRVDEINAGDPESPWKGRVWSFTTANFIPVDDFESYNDEEGTDTRIYETWIDGWADNSNGSTVGNLNPPFAERTNVHGGVQSMPFEYDNLESPFYSEAYREFSPLHNWTGNGVTDLSLWVMGYPVLQTFAITETAGKLTVTGAGADIWTTSDEFTFVYKTLDGDGSVVARVVSNGTGSNTWAKGGVMIRDSLNGGSTFADMVMTGSAGNGASFQYRLVADDVCGNSDSATVVAPPYWVKLERTGDNLTGYLSTDGKTWALQGFPQLISMSAPVYIGLCVTSHAAGQDRTFEFDSVKTTGAVSGNWQGAIITSPLTNTQQPLYVIVEDSTGKKATVTNPDPAAVNVVDWTEWKIPLSSLTGVNLAKVKKLYIGVGDKSAVGNGKLFIDDIRVTKPEPTP